MKQKDLNNNLKNIENFSDYTERSNPEFQRQANIDKTHDWLNKIDWKKETDYYMATRVNGKNVPGRAIKMSNKEWHRLNKK